MSLLRKPKAQAAVGAFPRDDVLPGLSTLLDETKMLRRLQSESQESRTKVTACRARYVRYKPATNCLVAYAVTVADIRTGATSDVWYYGKCYLAEDFRLAYGKIEDRHPRSEQQLEPVLVLPEACVIIYLYLNDRSLPGLQETHDPRKLVRLMHDWLPDRPRSKWRLSDKKLKVEVIRYKPEKRAVAKIETRAVERARGMREQLTLYARIYANEQGEAQHELMSKLYEETDSVSQLTVPRPLAYLPSQRLLFIEGVSGEPLLPRLQELGDISLRRTGAALARFHALEVTDLPKRTPEVLASEVAATANTLIHLMPELAPRIEKIVSCLRAGIEEAWRGEIGLTHGDFYYDQVLLQESGEAILDFDRTCLSPILCDVGNFVAHLTYLKLTAQWSNTEQMKDNFLAGYTELSSSPIDPAGLQFWSALGLFQLSVKPFRTVLPDWRTTMATIIEHCEQVMP